MARPPEIADTGIMASTVDQLSELGDVELGVLLAQLEREERLVSKRRSTLHDRIDFVRAGGYASADPAEEQLSALQATEHELSGRRRVLHQKIDELRAERSRRRA